MREQDRLVVVDRINDDIKQREILATYREELEELKKNSDVCRYLELLDIIEKMANKQCFFDSLARNIYLQFVWAFESRVRTDGIHPCMHEIWMYDGSYMVESDYYNEREWEVLVSSEDNKNFDYNRYICLECGKYFNTPNWKEFEETHFVLKNYDRASKSISYFRQLYYQLLYTNSVDTAQTMIIDKFNKDLKGNNKILKKKK